MTIGWFVIIFWMLFLVDGNFGLKEDSLIQCTEKGDGIVECDGKTFKEEEKKVGGVEFWIYLGLSILLVLIAGIMSGLTMGLMSLDEMDLEILQRGGEPKQAHLAGKIIPLIRKHHLTLVTLLLANAAAMEALPIILDRITAPWIAILVSVTAVLLFGEIIPQAICTRFGLVIGARMAWLVHILIWISFPVAWPISKLLDCLLGHENRLYRRKELKELVTIHGGKGGPLTFDECTIIKGALDLKEKTVFNVMVRIENVFMLSINDRLDKQTIVKILDTGHSRIPIFEGERQNIKGMLLVKNLILFDPEEAVPVSKSRIRPLPTVPSIMPLYDILNEFQTGKSHMALVRSPLSQEIVGIVSLEDVLEELIQEEIVDETDVYIDVESRVRVARMFRTLSHKQDESLKVPLEQLRPIVMDAKADFIVGSPDEPSEETPLLLHIESSN